MIQLEDRLYTSTEVAEILGVSLRSVYRYIDENKLDAEVKTATGRHRFTKKNILDFLYPSEAFVASNNSENKEVAKKSPFTPKEVKEEIIDTKGMEEEEEEVAKIEEKAAINTNDVVTEEEPIDWLAKFREAAKKFKEESQSTENNEISHQKEINVPNDTFANESLSNLTTHKVVDTPKKHEVEYNYFRSSLGGLKDIAQNLDKNARATNLEYAFTQNAGLSLYKPIKPFSLLHAYIKPNDLVYFERTLMLSPSDMTNAQLCLITDMDESIYGNREELHGLYVVDKMKLKEDIAASSDQSLIEEARGLL